MENKNIVPGSVLKHPIYGLWEVPQSGVSFKFISHKEHSYHFGVQQLIKESGPVPITPELLTDGLGWKKINAFSSYYKGDCESTIELLKTIKGTFTAWYHNHHEPVECSHLHTLQSLLSGLGVPHRVDLKALRS